MPWKNTQSCQNEALMTLKWGNEDPIINDRMEAKREVGVLKFETHRGRISYPQFIICFDLCKTILFV